MKRTNKIFRRVGIVIPTFNEDQRIDKLVNELKTTNNPIVVVDDGSKNKFSLKSSKNLTILHHQINLGKGAAMKTGCEYAFNMLNVDAVVLMDADGQHLVKDLDKFIRKINDNYGVVFGSRSFNKATPLVRHLGNRLASMFVSLLYGVFIADLTCGYRGITKSAFNRIKWESARYGVETEMVVRTIISRLKYCEVPVETVYLDGVKGVTPLDALSIFMDVVRWKITL
jgi:polyprenyl-phospho-N-acetylgalactosaminyl synthase